MMGFGGKVLSALRVSTRMIDVGPIKAIRQVSSNTSRLTASEEEASAYDGDVNSEQKGATRQ